MKRLIFLIFGPLLVLLTVHAQKISWNKSYQDYIDQYREVAVQQMLMHGIPASITLAQGVLESGAGRSELARKVKNHFGIKCNGWTGRKSYHDDDMPNECFRAYDSAYESYEDHSAFLTGNRRYSRLFDLKRTDYKGWAKGLKACGYATSPTYASQLIAIIELYDLHKLDKAKSYDHLAIKQLKKGLSREIHEFNNNCYVIAKQGDTFKSLADELDMSYRSLARFNERDKNDTLEEGEYVWLKKKRRKAPKEYKKYEHTVQVDESMYSIAQHYGIRLKNLYKINRLSPDYVISVGDKLKVR